MAVFKETFADFLGIPVESLTIDGMEEEFKDLYEKMFSAMVEKKREEELQAELLRQEEEEIEGIKLQMAEMNKQMEILSEEPECKKIGLQPFAVLIMGFIINALKGVFGNVHLPSQNETTNKAFVKPKLYTLHKSVPGKFERLEISKIRQIVDDNDHFDNTFISELTKTVDIDNILDGVIQIWDEKLASFNRLQFDWNENADLKTKLLQRISIYEDDNSLKDELAKLESEVNELKAMQEKVCNIVKTAMLSNMDHEKASLLADLFVSTMKKEAYDYAVKLIQNKQVMFEFDSVNVDEASKEYMGLIKDKCRIQRNIESGLKEIDGNTQEIRLKLAEIAKTMEEKLPSSKREFSGKAEELLQVSENISETLAELPVVSTNKYDHLVNNASELVKLAETGNRDLLSDDLTKETGEAAALIDVNNSALRHICRREEKLTKMALLSELKIKSAFEEVEKSSKDFYESIDFAVNLNESLDVLVNYENRRAKLDKFTET